ncbi:MAG: MFS transporter [Micromonosporaceae bacterium]
MVRRSIVSSAAGTALEWYEFYLYGAAAALVFNKLFFPGYDPVAGTLLAFATYAFGFGARPLGAVLAGHYGDRIGRRNTLVVTITLTFIATALIGALPTHAQVGVLAPILLVLMRLLQGIGLGGEWAGGALNIAERVAPRWRGFLASFVQVGAPIGSLLSTGVLLLFSVMLTEGQFLGWGWRIPFLLSAVIGAVALYIRFRLTETPVFEQSAKENRHPVRSPVSVAVRKAHRQILRVIGIRFGADIVYYTAAVFSITYVTQYLKLDQSVVLNALLVAGIVNIVVYPLSAALSDQIGRRRVTIAGGVLSLIWAFAYFPMLDTKVGWVIAFAVVSGMVCNGIMYGLQAAWISELFDTEIRYSGASIGYQMTSLVGGGIAPFVAAGLLYWFDSSWPVVGYVVVAVLLTLYTVVTSPETVGRDLSTPYHQGVGEREVGVPKVATAPGVE